MISGYCYVIDGDTIVIDGRHIRLAGIDAPELDHPWGLKSKWALFALCKGQRITAHLKPELTHGRLVAECFLPDGRDLAAELVKAGLALDWPKFSGGKYRHLETPDARRKLWRANLRQSGVMWPTDDVLPGMTKTVVLQSRTPTPPPVVKTAPLPRPSYWMGWLFASSAFVLLVGCQLIGNNTNRTTPAAVTQQVSAFASFEVTASALNIRERPASGARVLGQIGGGTTVTPQQMSGPWYGIEMNDGSMGWVHSDFLSRTGE